MAGLVPGTEIRTIAKEAPFNSYRLSSAKLRAAGCDFRWDMKRGVRDRRGRFSCLAARPRRPA